MSTHKFQKGDKVRRIQSSNLLQIGRIYNVVSVNFLGGLLIEEATGVYDPNCFELVEKAKANTFDMKTEPWVIKIKDPKEADAIYDWLESLGFDEINFRQFPDIQFVSNVRGDHSPGTTLHYGSKIHNAFAYNRKLIEINFECKVKSFKLPKSEAELEEEKVRKAKIQTKIEALEAELAELKKELV